MNITKFRSEFTFGPPNWEVYAGTLECLLEMRLGLIQKEVDLLKAKYPNSEELKRIEIWTSLPNEEEE